MAENALKTDLLKQLRALLDGGQAHATLADAVADMPPALQGSRPDGVPYSAWQLLEHLRITQRDILDFSDNADGSYKPLEWPAQYWPAEAEPPTADAWASAIKAIQHDRQAFESLLETRDLVQPFPWGEGQNLLREALLIGDHNAYHIGELVLLRRLLGA